VRRSGASSAIQASPGGSPCWRLFPACAVLLLKSLPEGYAAPNLSRVLAETGNMERRTYRRLLGVLQLLLNVSTPGGFRPEGKCPSSDELRYRAAYLTGGSGSSDFNLSGFLLVQQATILDGVAFDPFSFSCRIVWARPK
jgi:hypothetical protein